MTNRRHHSMRPASMAATLVLSVGMGLCSSAQADPCATEIAALFDGGALDPFAHLPRVETTVVLASDGTTTPLVEVTLETMTRSASTAAGVHYITDATRCWIGPGPDGPWSDTGVPLPADGEARVRVQTQSLQRNLTETACLGTGDLGGQQVTAYRYRTRTDPSPEGYWGGGLYTAYVDPVTGRLVRLDQTERISSASETVASDTEVMTVQYDPSIRVAVPD